LSLALGCSLAVKVEMATDSHRRRSEMQRLHAQGDQDAALREAVRPPTNGWTVLALCFVAGGAFAGAAHLLLGW